MTGCPNHDGGAVLRARPLSWQRRLRAQLFGSVVFALSVGGAWDGAHAAPTPGAVSASVADGFARLIFTMKTEVRAEVTIANGVAIIAFKQPIELSIEQLATALPGYVAVARRDPDGLAVRLALARRVKANVMVAGEQVFIDLLPEDWAGAPPSLPQSVVDALARRARDAERVSRERDTKPAPVSSLVRLRVANAPTFTRYSFELPGNTAVRAERERDLLALRFDAGLRFDMAEAQSALPPAVANISTDGKADQASLRFTLVGKVDVRTFRDGGSFVVDIGAAGAPAHRPNAEPSESGRDWMPAEDVPRQSGDAGPSPPSALIRPAATSPKPSVQTAQQPAAPASVVAQVTRDGDRLRLRLPFEAALSAAGFRHGDDVWLVLDTPVPLDLAAVQGLAELRDPIVTPVANGQLLRLTLREGLAVAMTADGTAWDLNVAADASAARPITVTHQPTGETRFSFSDARSIHRVLDPGTGEAFVFVTGPGPAQGLPGHYEATDFRAEASLHGIVLAVFADDVTVHIGRKDVAVRRAGAEARSNATPTRVVNLKPLLIEAEAWGAYRESDYKARYAELAGVAAETSGEKRRAARLALATFHLAHGQYSDAKGILDLTLPSGSAGAAIADPLLLRGVAHLLMNRPDQALDDLANAAIKDRDEAAVWRGVALARLGRFDEARSILAGTDTARLPPDLRAITLVETARTAIARGDAPAAAAALDMIERLGASAELRATVAILSGQIAELNGQPEDALAAYRSARGDGDRLADASAGLREVVARRSAKQMSPSEAVAALETLTAVWRGDETEAEANYVLGKLYADEGRFRAMFDITRASTAAHARSNWTRRLQDDATSLFARLFLTDAGDSMPPVEALGLFYDFRHLAPVGRRGDEMIRRLADRLVSVDLLAQASELLQHQIDHRVAGAARARVAASLAAIYLMHRKPERALAALRASRTNDLPSDLRRQRVLLEARALSDGGRHGLALEIVQALAGDADRLRADIHWAARHWQNTAEQLERLLGERWRMDAPPEPLERADILRMAVAYALAEDALGSARVRERYGALMRATTDGRIFDVVTAPADARAPEFQAAARSALSVDTLAAFLRDLRARESAGVAARASAKRG